MNKKEFKFALSRFHLIWRVSIGICLISIAIIGGCSELPEITEFGYELGIIVMPIVTSVLVSIILFFFTTHLQQSSKKMEAINRFDDFRDSLVDILRFCQNESEYNDNSHTFFETNLFDLYNIYISQKAIEKEIWIKHNERHFLFANWLEILIGTSVFIQKSNTFNSLNDKYFNKIIVFHLARKALNRDKDHNAFLKNLIYCITEINKLISFDPEYKYAYKLRFNKSLELKELKNEISISY